MSAVGPSATTSPSASTTTRSAHARDELDVVGRDDDGVPVARRGSATIVANRSLAVGSSPRVGSSSSSTSGAAVSCSASTSASRCPSDRSRGCASDGDADGEPIEQRAAGAGGCARVGVGLRALGRDGRQVQQIARELAARARRCGEPRPAGRRVPTSTPGGPEPCSAQSSDDLPEPLRPISATTSPRVQVEVDLADRDRARRTPR